MIVSEFQQSRREKRSDPAVLNLHRISFFATRRLIVPGERSWPWRSGPAGLLRIVMLPWRVSRYVQPVAFQTRKSDSPSTLRSISCPDLRDEPSLLSFAVNECCCEAYRVVVP